MFFSNKKNIFKNNINNSIFTKERKVKSKDNLLFIKIPNRFALSIKPVRDKYNKSNNMFLQKIKIFAVFENCWYNTNEVIAMLLKKERCLEKIRPFYDLDIIKVLVGSRRTAKSKVLESNLRKRSRRTRYTLHKLWKSGFLKKYLIIRN